MTAVLGALQRGEASGEAPKSRIVGATGFAAWVLLGFACSLAMDGDTGRPAHYAVGVAVGAATLLAVAFLPPRWLLYPLFVLLINAPDLNQSLDDVLEFGERGGATPWQFHLGPLTPGLLVFAVVLTVLLRLPRAPVPRVHRWLLAYLLTVVPIVAVFYGYLQESPGKFITDAKIPMYFGLGLLLFERYFHRYRDEVPRALVIFIALAGGRYLLDATYLFADIPKALISGFNRVSVDSAKGVLASLIFVCLARAFHGPGRWLAALVLPPAVYLLIGYQTRWLVGMLLAGMLLVLLVVGTRRAVRGLVIAGLLAGLSVPTLTALRPEVMDAASRRFLSITMTREQGAIDLEAIDATRLSAIVNVSALLWRRGALLTGLGYGSWYTDDVVPMPFLNESAFDAESLANRQFFWVHDFIFHMLLKIGLIGLIAYVVTVGQPLRALWRRRHRLLRDPQGRQLLIVFVGSAPVIVTTLFWTGKGLLLTALFVAAMRAVERSVAEPTGTAV